MTRIWWLAILMMGMAGCSHKQAQPTGITGQLPVEFTRQTTVLPPGGTSQGIAYFNSKEKAFTLVHHTHSVQIVGRGIKVNIDYADNDPEAVDVFAQGIADYLNSLGDNPEFPEAKKANKTGSVTASEPLTAHYPPGGTHWCDSSETIICSGNISVPNSGLVSHQQFGGMYYQADPEPNGPCELGHPCTIPFVEPVDVPAITRQRKECIKYSSLSFGNSPPCETYGDVDYAACEDETRILLPSQNGVMHCLKFQEAK